MAEQVRNLVPDEWKVTRLAIDGAVTSIIFSQLEDLPTDTTHIVISVGGNDALGEAEVLDAPAHSVADVLQQLAEIQDRFREDYARMLDATAQRNLPTAVCTVYDPRYPDPLQRRIGSLGLSVINDVVTREAFLRNLSLIDLRVMFDADEDFANPIEPSVHALPLIVGPMRCAKQISVTTASQRQGRLSDHEAEELRALLRTPPLQFYGELENETRQRCGRVIAEAKYGAWVIKV